MEIKLSDNFNYLKLIKFTIPTIAMLIFTSIYSIVDGFFVSNYVGKTEFAAINLVFPCIVMLGAFGFMFGTGGSAIIAKTIGENDNQKATKYFSMIVYASIIIALFFTILGYFLIEPVVIKLGASGDLLFNSVLYGRILILSLTPFILQSLFQIFFITAGKPNLGLKITLFAGCTNMILDYIFIAHFGLELKGAAYATVISQIFGGVIPLIYFTHKNSSLLRLTKTNIDLNILTKAAINGSSEMLTNISMSLINILYMWQLLRMAGENGIAAYGVIMYLEFIFSGIYLGFSTGSAPVVSYNFGAKNTYELKNLFIKSLIIISVLGITLTGLAELFAYPLSGIFVGYDNNLHNMTTNGFRLYALAFLIMGFNIYASAFYTALNNGIISAIISFMRTFVFQIASVLILPLFLGINGIWGAIAVSEFITLVISTGFLISTRKRYGYI